MNFKSIGLKVAIATAVVATSAAAMAPAQAASLTGGIAFSGGATVPNFFGNGGVIKFMPGTVNNASGSFTSLASSPVKVNVSDLVLSNPGAVSSPFLGTKQRVFDGSAFTINFANLNGSALSFVADPAKYVGTKSTGKFFSIATGGSLLGTFFNNGQTLGGGYFNASRSGKTATDGSYQFTLTATPVPTPALLPGLLALGAGVVRKRKSEATEVGTAETAKA